MELGNSLASEEKFPREMGFGKKENEDSGMIC
jgi:hypothetical protein